MDLKQLVLSLIWCCKNVYGMNVLPIAFNPAHNIGRTGGDECSLSSASDVVKSSDTYFIILNLIQKKTCSTLKKYYNYVYYYISIDIPLSFIMSRNPILWKLRLLNFHSSIQQNQIDRMIFKYY